MEESIQKISLRKKYFWLLTPFLAVLAFFIGPLSASAASLYFAPANNSYQVGQSFAVNVYVSSADQTMNAASGSVSFPADKLEVTSISKANSVFSLWVQEPSFSNSAGTVNFEGIVLNPGFTGSAGRIMTINFRAKTAGAASLRFSSGSVLANDGQGTNILYNLGSGSYQLTSKQAENPDVPSSEQPDVLPEATVTAIDQKPSAPVVSSSHVDQEQWKADNNVIFSWSLPSDVTDISYELDKEPDTNPKFSTKDKISRMVYSDLDDGIWYFHINFKNKAGWGELTHYKILIDTKPPFIPDVRFQIENSSDPRPVMILSAHDKESSVVNYEIKLVGGNIEETYYTTDSNFQLPPQMPGQYQVTVKAYDQAGNVSLTSSAVEILPLPTSEIVFLPEILSTEETLFLKGRSLANVLVKIFLQSVASGEVFVEEFFAKDADWSYAYNGHLPSGQYEVWTQIQDERGALSLPSNKFVLTIDESANLRSRGKSLTPLIWVLFAIILLLLMALLYSRYEIYHLRRKFKKTGLQVFTKKKSRAPLSSFRRSQKAKKNKKTVLLRNKANKIVKSPAKTTKKKKRVGSSQ